MTRFLASLVIRDMKIKTIIRYHLTLVRIAITKKSTSNKCGKVWRDGNPSVLLVGMQIGSVTMENSMRFLKNKK